MGRRATPEGLNAARGNPRKRKKADSKRGGEKPARPDDAIESVLGPAPDELTKEGKALWRAMAGDLARMNFVKVTDRAAFTRYCDLLATYWIVTRQLRRPKERLVYITETNHGTMKRINPLFQIQSRIDYRLGKLEDSFGLTPAARQQLQLKMAAAPPAGDLFGKRDGSDTSDSPEQPAGEPESPIGILGGRSLLH